MSGRGGSKGGGGKKGYRTKATQLEAVVRDKLNSLAKLQNEAIFLRQKGAVLEQLLEVASEVAVHKREHTGIKFPNLHDPQLLEFLENFLENYGGFGAERPTAQNYFNLQKLDVDQFKDVRYEDFKQKYTSLVQCLSLLLLQATDDSLKGGLTTTMDELKQLLLGTLLWSPLTFMQVGTQNLQTGDEVLADPSHSDQAITGIQLTPEQEDVLVIIGDLYNTQVATLEATHNNLSQSLDAELLQGTSDTGGVAATIMRINSNMHRLLAIHQLFHIAIMHNLADQQLAHLCVRCFPRFPRMQDLLNALVRIRENRGKGLDLPEPPGHSTGRGLALGINMQGNAKLKPPALEPSVLSKGRLAEAGSKFLQSSSGMLSNGSAGAAVKDEAKSVGGGLGDFEPVGDAAATAEQAVPKSPMADVVKSSGKDGWDAQNHEAGSTTPVKPDNSGMLAAPGSSHKRPRSPTPVAAGSNRMGSGSGSKPAKKVSTTGGDMGSTYGAVSSSAQGSRRSKQGAPGKDSRDGIDVNMAVVAAAAAAGMPVDPAAAAALPVPLEHFPAPQQRPSNGVGQQGGLTSMHIQQLAAHLNAAGGPQDMAQMLESQPKLMLLLQQRPELMGELQEAMQQQAQQAGMADYAAAQHAAALQAQGMQHQQRGYPAAGRASADGLTQQHWQQAGLQGSGRSSGMPALEMLPPSLVPKDTSSTTPMQTLLHSLSTLLQSCTSVQEAASAAIDMGQAEFVLSAVSAAEAAFATAVKGLADIKARCNRGYSSSAAAAVAAGHAAGVMEPALSSGMGASLHPAGAGGNRLQPPAGIPVPGPHAAQQALPQSVSLALSGLHSAEVPPTQSTSALLAGMGLSQGLSSVSQVLMQQQQQVGRGSSRQQGYPSAPGSGPNSTGRGGAAADIQQVSVSMVLQQLSTIKDNPSAIAQLVQILDQQQLLTPEVSSVLAQMMTHASLGQTAAVAPAAAAAASAPADTMSNVAALMQQIQQQQQAGLKQVPSSAAMAAAAQAGKSAGGFGPWGGAGRHSDGLSAYDAVAAAAAAGYHMPSSLAMGQTAGASREMLLGAAPTDAAAAVAAGPACMPPASAAAAATGAAAGGAAKGTDKQKEDSPSAGSSTTNTGQSGMQQEGQPGPSDPAAAANAAHIARQAGVDQQQQQLEGIARAAAAAMTGQLQASGQAEALMSTVMQLLQGQVGADGAASSLGAVAASLLQAMTASGGAGGPAVQLQLPLPQQQLQPHHGLAAAAGADAATTLGQSSQQPLGQSAAAAATMIPPAAAAAMAAKKKGASAPSAREPASDFADMEVDAVSALEMLAAAAVAEGPQRKRGGNRDR